MLTLYCVCAANVGHYVEHNNSSEAMNGEQKTVKLKAHLRKHQ